MARRDYVRLLEVEPRLGARLPRPELADARRVAVAPVATLSVGHWDADELPTAGLAVARRSDAWSPMASSHTTWRSMVGWRRTCWDGVTSWRRASGRAGAFQRSASSTYQSRRGSRCWTRPSSRWRSGGRRSPARSSSRPNGSPRARRHAPVDQPDSPCRPAHRGVALAPRRSLGARRGRRCRRAARHGTRGDQPACGRAPPDRVDRAWSPCRAKARHASGQRHMAARARSARRCSIDHVVCGADAGGPPAGCQGLRGSASGTHG